MFRELKHPGDVFNCFDARHLDHLPNLNKRELYYTDSPTHIATLPSTRTTPFIHHSHTPQTYSQRTPYTERKRAIKGGKARKIKYISNLHVFAKRKFIAEKNPDRSLPVANSVLYMCVCVYIHMLSVCAQLTQ